MQLVKTLNRARIADSSIGRSRPQKRVSLFTPLRHKALPFAALASPPPRTQVQGEINPKTGGASVQAAGCSAANPPRNAKGYLGGLGQDCLHGQTRRRRPTATMGAIVWALIFWAQSQVGILARGVAETRQGLHPERKNNFPAYDAKWTQPDIVPIMGRTGTTDLFSATGTSGCECCQEARQQGDEAAERPGGQAFTVE